MIGISVYLLIVAALLVLALRKPVISLVGLLVLMFPLDQWATITASNYVTDIRTTNLVIGIIVLLAAIKAVLTGSFKSVKLGMIYVLSFILFSYAFISILWTPVPDIALAQWRDRAPYIVLGAFVAPFLVQTYDDLDYLLRYIIVLGVPFALFLTFYVDWGYRGFGLDEIGQDAVRINPLALGHFGGIMMIVAALIDRKTKLWRLLRITAGALGIVLAVRSGSRGQFGFAILIIVFFLMLFRGKMSLGRLSIAFVTSTAMLAVGLAAAQLLTESDLVVGSSDARWSPENLTADTSARLEMSRRLLEFWLDTPATVLFGLGNSASFTVNGTYPHFVPAEVLGEEGVLGFAVFVAIVFCAGRLLLLTTIRLRHDGGRTKDHIVLGALAVFSLALMLKQGSLADSWSFFAMCHMVERVAFNVPRQRGQPRTTTATSGLNSKEEARMAYGEVVRSGRQRLARPRSY